MNNAILYKTIEKTAEGLYKEKGSKFLSFVVPCANETEAKQILEHYRSQYHDARHHCYAYRLGITDILERSNDDGEPSGTAGKPILGQLHSFEVTNIIAIVIRYFGGTKLGVGGLITAYKTATQDALSKAVIKQKELKRHYLIHFNYPQMGSLMAFLNKHSISYSDIDMQASCKLKIEISFGEEHYIDKLKNSLQIKNINELTPQ
jgi:uncharacterized YigZ family protein